MHSVFYDVEVYINDQQIYNSAGFYAHQFYISNNFTRSISEYKRFLHCEAYDYETNHDYVREAPMSDIFSPEA